MKILDLLKKSSIDLNVSVDSKKECIKQAVELMAKSGNIEDKKVYEKGVFDREKLSTTGVGNGIAIPHCKSDSVKKPGLVAMRSTAGIDWDSLDGENVNLIFLIAAPNTEENVHLDVLATLSRMLMHEDFRKDLMQAKDVEEFMEVIDKYEKKMNADDKGSSKPEDKDEDNNESEKKDDDKDKLILAVTSCPTGVAHTYMAKEALDKAAEKMGVKIKVQTNGSGGIENALTPEEIEEATSIIVAADAFVDMVSFDGKPVIECPVTKAIKEPEALINKALTGQAPIYKAEGGDMFQVSDGGGAGHQIYKHLMSGISHMIPFVIAGGVLLAISYLIDGLVGTPKDGMTIDGIQYAFGSVNIVARAFRELGATFALGLMLPVLGGFIAYSIAGKPALVSGFVGAFCATKGSFSLLYYFVCFTEGVKSPWAVQLASSSAGFIGAIAAGFIAGYFVKFLQKKALNGMPRTLAGIRDMMLVPLISTAFVGFCMFLLNVPFGYLNIFLGQGLMILKDANLILILGALVAGLMAVDMGGPVNKAAHYFVLSLVTTALEPNASAEMQTLAFQLMAANIVGIITPPTGIAIATWIFPQKFTRQERMPSLANFFIGCCGITEPAIPYVASQPLTTLGACIPGAAIGGVVSLILGMEAIAPEGGLISYFVMGAICWKGVVAVIVGMFTTAILLGIFRRDANPEEAALHGRKYIPIGRKFIPQENNK